MNFAQRSRLAGWRVFIGAGVSGSVPLADRPEGQRLLAVLQPGDVVVAAKLDRAFRSAAAALETLEELKKDKIGLHLIDLGGDVCGNGISKLVFTILSAVAENERDRIRERVRDAKRHRAEQRLYNGGKRQFGSDLVDGRLVPNARYRADEINAGLMAPHTVTSAASLACAARCSASPIGADQGRYPDPTRERKISGKG